MRSITVIACSSGRDQDGLFGAGIGALQERSEEALCVIGSPPHANQGARRHAVKVRAPRLEGPPNMPALMAGEPFIVLDISVTGSLGLIATELRIDSTHPFRLGSEGDALGMTAQVVRVASLREHGRWRTAVTFGEPTREARHEIAAVIVRLLRKY